MPKYAYLRNFNHRDRLSLMSRLSDVRQPSTAVQPAP